MSREEKDRKNQRLGMIVSAAAHIAVLILFIFLVAWRAPNPPHPEIGIELNFGTSNEGTGDVQPDPFTPAADTEAEEDAPESEEEVVEDIPEEVTEETLEEVTTPVQETTNETTETETVTPVTEQPTEAPVKEPEVVEEKKEEVKEEVKEEPKELPKVLYPGTKDGTADEAKKSNQGDKTEAVGDQGDKEGSVDERALYGKPGGGDGGAALEMTGWMWDKPPDPEESTPQDGKIVFEVTIDDRGEVVTARAVTYTVEC
jgi:protein TonB